MQMSQDKLKADLGKKDMELRVLKVGARDAKKREAEILKKQDKAHRDCEKMSKEISELKTSLEAAKKQASDLKKEHKAEAEARAKEMVEVKAKLYVASRNLESEEGNRRNAGDLIFSMDFIANFVLSVCRRSTT